MTRTMRNGVLAVIGVMAASFVAFPVKPVQAQGLLDLLFSPSRDQYRDRRYRGYRDRTYRERSYNPRGYAPSAPAVRVKGPSYYTYQPDVLKTFSLASLAQVETASADPSAILPASTPFTAALGQLSSVKVRTFREVASAIKTHYSGHPQFIWVTDGSVNDKARAALAALERADRFGLSPRDYLVEVPQDGLGRDDADARQKRLIVFEMNLSTRVLTYVLDATRGRIDPNRISGYHDLPRHEVDLGAAMDILASIDDVGGYLDARNPSNPHFKALVAELAELRTRDDTEKRVEIATGTFLRPGGSDTELAKIVAAIRERGTEPLKAKHQDTLAAYAGGEDYTPELVVLVRDFQSENGLRPDGIVGSATIRAMTSLSSGEKVNKVILAMERSRWLPAFLGSRYVFINQPAFQATYMHVGKKSLSMRIVVGQKANQTSFFMDTIETVEYNPYWGVPASIIINEMVPELYRDPSYLDRLGYEVTTQSGQRVSSRSVNWYGVANQSVPINVRQPPGSKNALGAVKIMFPNKHAIYMHDTPQKELFEKDARAFSHGCVRLQKPREMAAAVLGKSVGYVNKRIAEGQNKSEPVPGNIPVYVAYFTALPTPDGTVKYYDDMYERDDYLSRAIERTEATRRRRG